MLTASSKLEIEQGFEEEIKHLREMVEKQAEKIRELEQAMKAIEERSTNFEARLSFIENKVKQLPLAVEEQTNPAEHSVSSSSLGLAFSSQALALQEKGLVLIHAATPSIEQKEAKEVTEEMLNAFLQYVARGEQSEAEEMLKKNPDLALKSGTVTDLSKRTFKNMTGFQYAVWALDRHMWEMIKKYIPEKDLKEQAEKFETGDWVTEQGIHAEQLLINLRTALLKTASLIPTTYQYEGTEFEGVYVGDKFTTEIPEDYKVVFLQEVGSAQFFIPAHVANEYCHAGRLFYNQTNFTKDVLSRTRTISANAKQIDWFSLSSDGLPLLGKHFAVIRFLADKAQTANAENVPHAVSLNSDCGALQILTLARMKEREKLIAGLKPRSAATLFPRGK